MHSLECTAQQMQHSTGYLRQGLMCARHKFTKRLHVHAQCRCNRGHRFSSVILALGAPTHARQSLLPETHCNKMFRKRRFETTCCKRWHGHIEFGKQVPETLLRRSQKRRALFCGRGCTGLKLRHSHPGKHATTKQLRASQSRPSETCIKNLSLASVLSSASTQSCTTARAEAPKTRIFLIPYLGGHN